MTAKANPEKPTTGEPAEREEKEDGKLARDVAYHQAIVARGTTREASTLLFRESLAGR